MREPYLSLLFDKVHDANRPLDNGAGDGIETTLSDTP